MVKIDDLWAHNVTRSNALCAYRSAVFTSLGLRQMSNLSFGSRAKRFGKHWSKRPNWSIYRYSLPYTCVGDGSRLRSLPITYLNSTPGWLVDIYKLSFAIMFDPCFNVYWFHTDMCSIKQLFNHINPTFISILGTFLNIWQIGKP